MKKEILFFMLIVFFLVLKANAQVNPASQPDNHFFYAPNSNTGVAIAPNIGSHDFTVTVADEIGGNGHMIGVHKNPMGLVQPLFANIGEDPDVAFGANPDAFFVVSDDILSDEILLTEYHLNTLPFKYNQVNQFVIDFGGVSYPNIDMNAQWEGVVVYEKSGRIYARSFVPFGMGSSSVLIGIGTQPDVAMHETTGEYTITYLDSAGDLVIESHQYIPLTSGLPALTSSNTYPAPGSLNAPRIATIHNSAIGPFFSEFTVVVSTPASGEIWGYFFDGSTMNPNILINIGTVGCQNDFPVVAYQWDRVSIAWASDYLPCGLSGGSGMGVLKEELDFMGNTMTGYIFDEVNQMGGSFNKSKSAITSQYDGDYPIPGGFYNESVVYHDGFDIFWKNRNINLIPTYKQGNSSEIDNQNKELTSGNENTSTNNLFSFKNITEDKILKIEMNGDQQKYVSIYNIQGQQLFNKTIDSNTHEIVINYTNLPRGLLIVHSITNGIKTAYKIVNF